MKHRVDFLRKENFWEYLFTFDGHHRLEPFVTIAHLLDDASYWKCLALVWDNIEVSFPDMTIWLSLFNSDRSQRHHLMSKKEHREFEQLPDDLTLFRGYASGHARRGMSWTLSEERARFFDRARNESGVFSCR